MGWTYDDPFNPPTAGYIYDRNGFTRFDFPQASETLPNSINDFGMHAGNFFDPLFGTGDGYVTIYGYPYEIYADVFGLNERNQIVGDTFDFTTGRFVGYVADLPISGGGNN